MTLLTIEEAAAFLKVDKRTMFRHRDIPRVKIGGQLRFIQEDLENWVRAQDPSERRVLGAEGSELDRPGRKVVHKNGLFVLQRARTAQ